MFGGLMGALMGRNRKPAMAGAPASPMGMLGGGSPAMPMDEAPVEKSMPAGLDPNAMEPMQKTLPGGMTMDQLGAVKAAPGGVGSMLGGMFGGAPRMATPGLGLGRMMGGIMGNRPSAMPPMGMNVPGLRPGMQPSLRDTLMMRKPAMQATDYENPVNPSAE